jgi:aminopeptidase N
VLVDSGRARLVVPGCGTVVVNAGQSGYFRTLYAGEQQAALRDAFATLDPIDQLGLVDDAWAFAWPADSRWSTRSSWSRERRSRPTKRPGAASPTDCMPFDDFYRGVPARQAAWRAWAGHGSGRCWRDRLAGAGG